ncbi:MAG TPA: TolC family protein, partial [Terriglobia bacterium]|nr:TolC family protein [Terriglobia bacterium]
MIVKVDKAEVFIFLAALIVSFGQFAAAQSGIAAPGTLSYETSAASSSGALGSSQSPFTGSVPQGELTSETIPISVKDAIERGLRYNLGLLIGEQTTKAARGARWQALSKMLPHLNADVTETRQEINLQALGFPGNIPGIPTIVGPFNTFDARASLSAPVIDLHAWRNEHAASEDVRAAEYSYQDARNLVVLVVGNAYLLANAGAAQVQTAQAEVNTAQALYQQAVDRLHAGLSPRIDMLRAQVELKSRQEQLIAAQHDYATEKLNLGRVIGLP